MKKSILYSLFLFFSAQGFAQSFIKTYSDLAPYYAGFNVVPINSKQTAVIGTYIGVFNGYNDNFTAIVDSNGERKYTDTNYPQASGENVGYNLIKTSNGFAFFHYAADWNLLGNEQYVVFTNDTLNSIKNYQFLYGYGTYTGDVNLYSLNKEVFFTATGWSTSIANPFKHFSYTYISNFDSSGNLKWSNIFGPNDSIIYPTQVFGSIITSDSSIAVMGIVADTLQLKKYDFAGNLKFDYKYSALGYRSIKYTSPYDGNVGYYVYGELIEVNKNILEFGNALDVSTNKYQLALEIVNLNGSLVAQKKFILNKDTANIIPIAVYATSDTTAVLNYTVAGSALNHYLIVDYKGDSLGSFILPACTVSTFDNCNYLCALDSNNQIIVREFNQQGAIIYKYVYQPSDSLNVCNDIKPLPYPGRFVLTGSSKNNLLIIKQDTSAYSLGEKNLIKKPANISVYPNPNNGTFTLSLSNANEKCRIEIYNIVGQKIYTKTLQTQSNNTINLIEQPEGIYFYRVLTETGELVGGGKLIIDK